VALCQNGPFMVATGSTLADRADRARMRSDVQGLIFDVMRFSLHDGPGIRTAVFLKGCPLDCWWCHNPEGLRSERELIYFADRCVRCGDCVTACPHHAISWNGGPVHNLEVCEKTGKCAAACPAGATQMVGRWVTVDQIVEELAKDQIFFDESGGGVTFSGGEPLLQARFLEAVLEECRARRIHTAVETCGVANQAALIRVARNADLFLYDIKFIDPEKHRKYTGASNENILTNLRALAAQHKNIVVRMPVIPSINDDEENSEDVARFLKTARLSRLDLLPYHQIGGEKYERLKRKYRLEGLKPPSHERVQAMAEEFRQRGLDVWVGG
jgi:pyruvate formate lyase activating enzyme